MPCKSRFRQGIALQKNRLAKTKPRLDHVGQDLAENITPAIIRRDANDGFRLLAQGLQKRLALLAKAGLKLDASILDKGLSHTERKGRRGKAGLPVLKPCMCMPIDAAICIRAMQSFLRAFSSSWARYHSHIKNCG